MKRVLSMALACILAISFAACGSSGTKQEGTAEKKVESKPAETKAETKTETKEQKSPVKIKWSYWIPEPTAVIKKFNESQKEVQLEYEMISSDQFINVINARMMSGEGPELFAYRFRDFYENMVKQDMIKDLTNEEFMKNISDKAIEYNKASNGKIYCLPLVSSTLYTYYNKDLFKKFNVKEPTNWDEFLEACAVLKKNGVAPFVQGSKDIWQNRWVALDPYLVMDMKQGNWTDKLEKGEVKFTDPEMLKQYKKIETFLKSGYLYEGSIGLNFVQAWQVFCEGKAAMMGGASFYIPQAYPQAKPNFDLGVMPMALNEKGEKQVIPYHPTMDVACVNNKSKNVESTMKFIRWLGTSENMTFYAKEAKALSSAKNTTGLFAPEAELLVSLEKFDKMERKMGPTALFNDYGKVIQDMIVGAKTAEQVVAELQKKHEETVLKAKK